MSDLALEGGSQQVHPVDQKLPGARLAALGMQHVLVMYAGAIAVPLIVGRALRRGSTAGAHHHPDPCTAPR